MTMRNERTEKWPRLAEKLGPPEITARNNMQRSSLHQALNGYKDVTALTIQDVSAN
jgi:hypothetical protein